MTDYDSTEKVERTDKGYRLTVESTRGTGTRDQDEVKAELRTEERPDSMELDELILDVRTAMRDLRSFHPDEDDEEGDL